MRVTVQFAKDMGVCEGAVAYLEKTFEEFGVTEMDYDLGSVFMHQQFDKMQEFASNFDEENHNDANDWLEFVRQLRFNPKAIMYFGDHIEKNEFMTPDGVVHASREEAEQHINLTVNEIIVGYKANFAVCGLKDTADGEQWVVLRDLETVNWSEYNRFSWSEMMGGQRFVTSSATEALAHYTYMTQFFDELEASKEAQKKAIKRKVADNNDVYEVWV